MQTVALLAFILAAVFVATECESPPEEIIPFPHDACFEHLHECTSTFNQNPVIAGLPGTQQQVIENIDNICVDYQTSADCARSDVDLCFPEMSHRIHSAFAVGDYLCSDDGKSNLREFQESVCYNNPSMATEIEGLPLLCVAEVTANPSSQQGDNDRCQIKSDIIDCIVREASGLCGNAAGEIFREIAGRLRSISSDDQCTVESAGEIVRRHLGDFKRIIVFKR